MNALKYNKEYQEKVKEQKRINKENRQQILDIYKQVAENKKRIAAEKAEKEKAEKEKVDEVFVPSVFNSVDDTAAYAADSTEAENNIVVETDCVEKD